MPPSGREAAIAERLQRIFDAYNRQDADEALSLVSPDFELNTAISVVSIRAPDGIRKWIEPEAFAEQRMDLLEVRVIDQNTALTQHHAWGRGAGSGLEVDQNFWVIWRFDADGVPTEARGFQDEASAREALGLS